MLAILIAALASNAARPELVVQTGHTTAALALSLSGDGRTLASGSAGTVVVWDVASAREIHPFPGTSPSLSRDGMLLALRGPDGAVHVVAVSGTEKRAVPGAGGFAIAPDGKWLATCGPSLSLWPVEGGDAVKLSDAPATRVAFSPDGKLMAAASAGSAALYELASRTELRKLATRAAAPASLAFSADGARLAVGDAEGFATVFETATGKQLAQVSEAVLGRAGGASGGGSAFNSVSLDDHGGALVATSGGDLLVFDVATGKQQLALTYRTTGSVDLSGAAFTPGGKTFFAGGDDGSIRLYRAAAAGEPVRTLAGQSARVEGVAFGKGGKLATGSADGRARFWDPASGTIGMILEEKEPAKLRNAGVDREYTGIESVVFSSDGRYFAAAHRNHIATLWDAATGKRLRDFRGHKVGALTSLALSRDGQLLLTASRDGTIKLWETKRGGILRTHDLGATAWSVAFAPDGETFAAALDRGVQIRDSSFDKLDEPDGGKTLRTLESPSRVTSVAYSPDGKQLAAACDDGKVRLYDPASGALLKTLAGHTGAVHAVAFSPDGKAVASASADATAALWDAATGDRTRVLAGHSADVDALSFNPEGSLLATTSRGESTTRLWEVARGEEVVTLISVGAKDSVARIPGDFFSTSNRAVARGVGFRLGARVFPFEQFDLKLDRPDLVLTRLRTTLFRLGLLDATRAAAMATRAEASAAAFRQRLAKLHFTEEQLSGDLRLPEVGLASRELPLTTHEKKLSLKVWAQDGDTQLDRLQVYDDDVPIFGTAGLDLRKEKPGRVEKIVAVELVPGRNKIQISALGSRGVESLKETFEVFYEGAAPPPELWVVAIGVADYQKADADFHKLTWTTKDAEALAAKLEEKKGAFAQVHVLRLLDADATREKILAARAFLARSKVDDEAVVFFAGHGLRDPRDKSYFLATVDIDPYDLPRRGLTEQEFQSLVDGIPARRKLLLIDACNSGDVSADGSPLVLASASGAEGAASRGFKVKSATALVEKQMQSCAQAPAPAEGARGFKKAGEASSCTPVTAQDSFELMQQMFSDLRRESGAMIISAAKGNEFADEKQDLKHGIFTWALLQGLQAPPGLRVSQLRDEVIRQVVEVSKGAQTPTSRQENLEFDFAVY